MAKRVSRRTFVAATGVAVAGAASGTLAQALRDDGGRVATKPMPTPGPGLGPTAPPEVMPPLAEAVDGYVATAPRVFRSGQVEQVSLSLFEGDVPAVGDVSVALLRDGRAVSEGSARVRGAGAVALSLPDLPEGAYDLRVAGERFEGTAAVRVEQGTIVLLESDKPVYQPGQTVHLRALSLDPTLRPARGEALIEVMDAKGIKVFERALTIDDYGMASVDLPLSSEPNLGVWKVKASVGERSGELDVRVERYVLPKYEVTLDLRKRWALASEGIAGVVSAEYSFGKPVEGEVVIVASRFVGEWEEYARVTKPLGGKLPFALPPVRYATGSPLAGGLASVRLDITVREEATGYEEKTSELVTIASSSVAVKLVPESATFKPSLPLSLLVVAQTPDKQPVDASVRVRVSYQDEAFGGAGQETHTVRVSKGAALLRLRPPADAVSLSAEASGPRGSSSWVKLDAGYSPSATFIHVEQASRGTLRVGQTARFAVSTTSEGTRRGEAMLRPYFYEVVARGGVVYSAYTRRAEIAVPLSPMMAPDARLLVYQVMPDGEVAADSVPFEVEGEYPQSVDLDTDRAEARPGDDVEIRVKTEGPAKVGLAAVDRSVFMLAENRLNLQQVFGELEKLYQAPQAELHEGEPLDGPMPLPEDAPMPDIGRPGMDPYAPTTNPGAKELFEQAGVVVLTNRTVPEGRRLFNEMPMAGGGVAQAEAGMAAGAQATVATSAEVADTSGVAQRSGARPAPKAGLAEVQRVRRYFPETWIWTDLETDRNGRATQRAAAPDSITTWMLRAVALSKEQGLGIGEAELRVFRPFFIQADLPYSVIRGERFPVKIALYNYGRTAQQFSVELEAAPWFRALGPRTRTVTVGANDVGAVAFMIRPGELGVQPLKVSARGRTAADAIEKQLIVEPEGVAREEVENLVLSAGATRTIRLAAPPGAVLGSARAQVALTGNVLSQTMEGLEGLIQMPFGCGEQNMLLLAPDVFVTRYLEETGQLKPEVLAKAERMMLTGYQRELTYRHGDGAFSAFGEQDGQGSLWLTAFVLKTFAQARGLIFVDERVLSSAADWIRGRQRPDGSFEAVGFVSHQELLGGVRGKTALTAFVAIALLEAKDGAAGNAVRYLERALSQTRDPYALAITAYALSLAKSPRAAAARKRLLALGRGSDDGLSWGGQPRGIPEDELEGPGEQPAGGIADGVAPSRPRPRGAGPAIETTGYAALALIEGGDLVSAAAAVRWLASQRNALGGFASTQDTVVALQAMTSAADSSRADIDATITLSAGSWRKQVRVTPRSADVLQVIDVPAGERLRIETRGRGRVMGQVVRRYNLPEAEQASRSAFELDVAYDADRVEVNDLVAVTASVRYTPGRRIAAGMIVLDVAVPTGFAPVEESIEKLVKRERKLKRWDVAGRKVILYIEDMLPGERLALRFQARALYPVRAQAVSSQAYAYYRPELRGEHLSRAMEVGAGRA